MDEVASKDALLIVDVQVDFCPGGALPIEGGDGVVPVINEWIRKTRAAGRPVLASRDWHPIGHPSFVTSGGPWPAHCLQDSPGAAFHPDLELPPDVIKVTKGTRFDRDQYSAFQDTGLEACLERLGVERLLVGGLALDVCVKATVLDALELGFQVRLLPGASLPVTRERGREALEAMRRAGAVCAEEGGA